MSTTDIADATLRVYVALQHLQLGRPTTEIADELGLSRFAIGRMVKRARDEGLVEVVSRLPEPVDPELSATLARRYGLRSALVVVSHIDTDDVVRGIVAGVAAGLVTGMIGDDDVVGLGPGRTIVEMCARIVDVHTCDVVQLTGVATDQPETYLDAILRLRTVAKGRMFPLHAPFLTTDRRSARVITGQAPVTQALQRMDHLDMAVLTVGGWPSSSLLATQLAQSGELEGLLEAGVVAEIGTTLLDEHGRVVRSLEGRLIGVTTDQLARVPTRVAIGGGPGKRQAVVAALKSGLIDAIVTDQVTARRAMDM
ncbi:hypothetical protein E4V99_06625 [Microbacterium sp. dk485]|uniref:sugar-binding transcriptional regulator n=1 Tax=Microbacterium sp. dk485 TaxID=2560021 RepID=UPI001072F9DB|nr:sugar-binding domain-containing protein [Microbacterium sp. dk485]TFV84718.1 hypothetical protein E4V99_06625 [Microbacterium sp. dk485]